MIRIYLLFTSLVLLITSLAWSGEPAADNIKVSDPYVKAVPPGTTNTAAFMKLTNSGTKEITLTGISSPVSGAAEVHVSVHEKGIMEMRHVKIVKIGGNETVIFRHDGYHIMLIGLKKPLKTGDQVPITLTFGDGSSLTVNAPVRRRMMKMKHE